MKRRRQDKLSNRTSASEKLTGSLRSQPLGAGLDRGISSNAADPSEM
jgi:hypothetical protein